MSQKSVPSNPPKTLTDSVYNLLRHDIIEGVHKPDSKLRIEFLKSTYEVGATPIREALSRLSSDGFVRTEGQRGFRVTPISAKDLSDITELRIMLEQKAMQSSFEQGDDNWESGIVTAFFHLTKAEKNKNADNILQWERRNKEFHESLISACTSQWLLRFYKIIYDQHKRYRNISLKSPATASRDLHAEHTRIYEAAMSRDIKTACDETELHIRRTADISQDILQEHLNAQAD
jgi:DNA-binding GntR family transcriptional regulator